MLRPLAVALLLAACGQEDDAPDPTPVGDASFEVLRYDYRFDLESRAASTELTLRITAEGDCVTLPFRAADLDGVTFDGEGLAGGRLEHGLARLCARSGWVADSEVVLGATMTVPETTWDDSQVGYSSVLDVEGAPFRYLVSWVGGCDRFGLCDSAPSSFARYRFTVTHPDGVRVLCPGTLTAAATETVCDFDFAGGPTYSTFGFAASPSWVKVDLGDWSGVDASLFDMPSADVAASFDVDHHAAFFAWMIDRFGPYPYGEELRFAIGPTYWSGFEHPGNIVLNDQLHRLGPLESAYSDPLAHTVDHEIAHQWAGDQTTLASTYDFVWKEAMAEYLSFVFEDEELAAGVASRTNFAWERFARGAEYWPVPGEEPPLIDYYGDVYGAGPMVLFRQIEALYDREAVLGALEALLGSERAIGVVEVKAALEDATGADLSRYFEAWVSGEGVPAWPTFAVEIAAGDAGAVTVTVRQDAPDAGLFGAAFVVRLRGGTDEVPESYDVSFDLGPDGAAEASATVTPGFVPTGYDFDPYGDTLATARDTAAVARPARHNPWVAPRHRRH